MEEEESQMQLGAREGKNSLVVHLTGWTLVYSTQESAVPGV